MKMRTPTHPGTVIRADVLPAFGLSCAEAARLLHTARPGLNNILTSKAALSPEMALKIEAVFGVEAEGLLQMQVAHDLAAARIASRDKLKGLRRLQPRAAAPDLEPEEEFPI